MKKLFSMVLATLLLFSLAACTEKETIVEADSITIEVVTETGTNEFTLDIETDKNLLELIDASEITITYSTSEYGAFVTGIDAISADTEGSYISISKNGEASMVGIESMTFVDGDIITFEIKTFTVTPASIDIEVVSETGTETFNVIINDGKNLLQLIDESDVSITFQTSEYGAYVTGIEDITATAGNYVAISKNGEASQVGIESMTFVDQDTITFEIIWYDTTLQNVDIAIDQFLDNHASNYVNATTIDYNVLSGLNILDLTDEYITSAEVSAYYDGVTPTTVTEYFKAIVIQGSVGLDTTQLVADMMAMFTTGPYGQTAYGLLAANITTTTNDVTTFNTNALTYYDTNSPYDSGLDTGAVELIALSMFMDKTDPLIADYLTWIATDQLETGGIKTRDSEYNGVVYPGTENAASMAQVVLGMIAVDEDPTGASYTQGTNNLITRLLEFKTDTGAYYWLIGDENADLFFSSQQVFLALVSYQEYKNSFAPVNPFLID